jgi:hypothetical protein
MYSHQTGSNLEIFLCVHANRATCILLTAVLRRCKHWRKPTSLTAALVLKRPLNVPKKGTKCIDLFAYNAAEDGKNDVNIFQNAESYSIAL